MVRYKKFTGNYREILEKTNLPADFAMHSQDGLQAIQNDIPRTPLFHFKKNLNPFLKLWNSRGAEHIYSQGDMTANIFYILYITFMMRNSEDPSSLSKDNTSSLCFAYFDDDNIPCGFSISSSKKDPTLWSCAIIRNTTGTPETREVTVFCRENMVESAGDKTLSKNVLKHILNEINSQEVQMTLSSIILENGQVNQEQLNFLTEQISIISNNMIYELTKILRFKLLKEPSSDDECLWLSLFIYDAVRMPANIINKLSLEDLSILENNPEESPYLTPYKTKVAKPGELDSIRQLARTNQDIQDFNEHYLTPPENDIEPALKALFSRRNGIRALFIVAVIATLIASFFFPPLTAIIALACVAVPTFYAWHNTSKAISIQENSKQLQDKIRLESFSNQRSRQFQVADSIIEKLQTIHKAHYIHPGSNSQSSLNAIDLNAQEEPDHNIGESPSYQHRS